MTPDLPALISVNTTTDDKEARGFQHGSLWAWGSNQGRQLGIPAPLRNMKRVARGPKRIRLKEKLASTGIYIAPEKVIALIYHIKVNESLPEDSKVPDYRIYHPEGTNNDAIASQYSINKIRRLLKDDNHPLGFLDHYNNLLEFMMEAINNRDQKGGLAEIIYHKPTEGYQLRQPDGTSENWELPESVKVLLMNLDGENLIEAVGAIRSAAGSGPFLSEVVNQVEVLMHREWNWSIGKLTDIGIPLHKALIMLKEYDKLRIARTSTDWNPQKSPSREPASLVLQKFRGIEKYVALHYTVAFSTKYMAPEIPFPFIETAAYMYAQGKLAADESLATAGEDILRYEIWRQDKNKDGEYIFRKAYDESLTRFKIGARRLAQVKGQIDKLLEPLVNAEQ